MATFNVNIHIIDDKAARDWKDAVLETNDEFWRAMEGASQALQAAKECGEGTIVDELYELGTTVLNNARKVYDTLNDVSNVVNTILGGLANFVSGAVGAITGAKNNFG